MNNLLHQSPYVIILGIIGSFIYLGFNIYFILRATKRIEKKIRTDQIELKKIFDKSFLESLSKDQEEILVTLLRREIEGLNDKQDKMIMEKTLNRKNFDNQKRFALKIFSESGLTESLSI